jgi:hypothetical protein
MLPANACGKRYRSKGLMNRGIAGIFAASTLILGACNGWPATLPYKQAVRMPEKYVTYTAAPTESVPVFMAGNHRYMVMPGEANVRGARTSTVASGGGTSVFALEGDAAPFANLFARSADGRVHAVAPID